MNKKVIHYVFEAYAANNKLQLAIETEHSKISYDLLNTQANRIAHLLALKGGGKETITAVLFQEELLQIYALLGIFKSGAIYLPLDEKYKESHWAEVYTVMQPKFILTTKDKLDLINHFDSIFEYTIPEAIVLEIDGNGILNFSVYQLVAGKYQKTWTVADLPDTNPEIQLDGEDANYIFFTSGSSGKPKAILGCHKSLSHFIHWETKELGIHEKDRIGQLTSFSFDASLRDIFVPLISGGTICIPPKRVKTDVSKFAKWLSEKKISLLHTIPTWFRLLTSIGAGKKEMGKFTHLRYLLLAGEKLYNKDIINWREAYGDHTTLINLYGATETTLVKSFYKVEKVLKGIPSDILSVGKPISNTSFIILNADQQLCRINEVGEIFIKTPFLSKGYYKEEVLTREKFVQNPLNSQTDIIYKTGDYGKYDAERNVIVLGRKKDGLAKINGARVDMNSIEQTILGLDNILAVKCILHKRENESLCLICFYTALNKMDDVVRTYCLQHLSTYQLPSVYIYLEQFPVNVNGKIDQVALAEKVVELLTEKIEIKAPVNETEEKLLTIWKEVLELESISTSDNFFALGGQSLNMMLLINKINQWFGQKITVEEFHNNLTIEDLSKLLASKNKRSFDSINPIPITTNGYPVSNEQLRIWLTSQSEQQSVAHNMSYSYNISGPFDLKSFIRAWQMIIDRHEALRTSFIVDEKGEVVQQVSKVIEIESALEYHLVDESFNDEKADTYLKKFSCYVFDLELAPLFRLMLIEFNNEQFVLSALMHHIIGDHRSIEIIIQELIQLYKGFQNNVPVSLIPLKVQYKDYVDWVKQKLSSGKFVEEQLFWKKYLNTLHKEQKWYKYSATIDSSGAYYQESICADLTKKVKSYCKELNQSPMNLIAAALSILFYKISGQKNILIGLPVNLRNHPDLTGQVGIYLNLLPLNIQINPEERISTLLNDTVKNQIQLLDHSFYPFDIIVDEFEQNKHFNLIDRIDLYLNYINHTAPEDEIIDSVKFSPRERALKMSKFPICFYVNNFESTIDFRIEYQTNLFEDKFINKLGERFCNCLAELLKDPNKQIRNINLVNKKVIPVFSLKPNLIS